ncbi:MAG TPA: aldo/keto reductase [Chloroflexi bacterium]|nr:aldo/keto reductase [Chloroflexota bacterium]
MHYRTLGNTGLKVSAVGLGTNRFGGKVDFLTVNEILSAALDAGINFLDTADMYQKGRSEESIGEALKGRRDRFVVATKFYYPMGEGPNDHGGSRHHVVEAVEASLRRLQTDYIDLYQMHRWDAETPIEETLRALEDLIRAGKVRYIGASNFTAWQLVTANAAAQANGWTPFAAIQPHYHMLERGIEAELIPACVYHKIGILPYFPLAGGFLTGKYRADAPPPPGSRGEKNSYVQGYMTPENYARLEKLRAFAEARGHTMVELAHAWLLAQPQISSVISGVTRVEHVLSNAAGAEWQLSDTEVAEVNAILEGE